MLGGVRTEAAVGVGVEVPDCFGGSAAGTIVLSRCLVFDMIESFLICGQGLSV